ncbi:hypothetical protein C8Q80DRAFT_282197 [Daedaleopsis nitida]|nr:hypothetical protein C8Q80DRAFT_282197 [Daedaleopsis nitida]
MTLSASNALERLFKLRSLTTTYYYSHLYPYGLFCSSQPSRTAMPFEYAFRVNGPTNTRPQAATLRSCSQCNKPEQGRNILRRCGRCIDTIYCGKDCQRRAWHDHKLLCRPNTVLPPLVARMMDLKCRLLQHRSYKAILKNLEYFLEAHSWTLEAIVKLAAHLHGVDRLTSDPQVFNVVLRRPSGSARSHRGTPTDRLGVKSFYFRPLSDYLSQPAQRSAWEDKSSARRSLLFKNIKYGGPDFVTILHVCLCMDGLPQLERIIYVPVYRWSRTPVPSETTLRDAQSFCLASINNGFPLRCVLDVNPDVPLPGRFARRNGCWTWEPFFSSWDQYSPSPRTHKALDDALASFKSGLSPTDLVRVILKVS